MIGGIKIKRKGSYWSGIGIILVLIISFFINIEVDSGGNYSVYDSLLGIIIFHNPFILGFYVLISLVLVVRGLRG